MMEPDINNMTLNEYLMHEGRHRDLAKNYTFRKSVAPVRNRILVYPNSDEEDEEYCSMPPLLLYFQTPQPCTKFNSISHNVENEIDIDSMTLAEYDLSMAMQYKKDFSFEEILDDLFRIGGENLRSIKHEEVPNRCDEETVGDTGHESCNPLNFPTFSVTNVFASVCIQDDKNINISTIEEIEEVHVKDVGMDENHDIDL
ncbi:hypothetical protein Tco_0573915 [Tanacetum coccineum]